MRKSFSISSHSPFLLSLHFTSPPISSLSSFLHSLSISLSLFGPHFLAILSPDCHIRFCQPDHQIIYSSVDSRFSCIENAYHEIQPYPINWGYNYHTISQLSKSRFNIQISISDSGSGWSLFKDFRTISILIMEKHFVSDEIVDIFLYNTIETFLPFIEWIPIYRLLLQ